MPEPSVHAPSPLAGKRGLVFGVASERSIAWAITRAAHAAGASVALSYGTDKLARRVEPLADAVEAPWRGVCDVRDDDALDATFDAATGALGGLDFLVHSVAFAERDDLMGRFSDTGRAGFGLAMDVSVYSLVAMARRARPHLEAAGGGSLLTLTYYGAEKAVPGYNVMGVAKAALEASVRYLAADLGPDAIRCNAISAGPIKTLAAAGIPGFRDMLRAAAERAPLRRNVTADEVAALALPLLGDAGAGVTGEVLHVDAGYHAMGM
jgi:enoyl-[acyl-carrier protein] reductase I